MTIKHLVIPGGGPVGIQALGAIQYLEQNQYIQLENIESIYATSIGAIVGVLVALKYDWQAINDYIVKRPWQDVFQINVTQIFDIFSKKGLFDKNSIEVFFKPFFNSRDIPMEITMEHFYEKYPVELHIFSLETNKFEVVDCSYKTHPELSLITALQMSCAIPIIFAPVCVEDKCYVDGGVVCNDPLNYCIARAENVEEIFALCNYYGENTEDSIVTEDSSLIDFLINIISKMVNNVSKDFYPKQIPNQLNYQTDNMSLTFLQTCLSSSSVRQELLLKGIDSAKQYLEKKMKS